MVVLVVGLVRVTAEAVSRAGADVHEPLHPGHPGQFQQVAGAGEVDVQKVLAAGRLPVGAIHREHGGVNHFLESVGFPQSVQAGRVQDVAADEGNARGQFTQKALHQRVIGQYVQADHVMPPGRQLLHDIGPDKADAAGHQRCHPLLLPGGGDASTNPAGTRAPSSCMDWNCGRQYAPARNQIQPGLAIAGILSK